MAVETVPIYNLSTRARVKTWTGDVQPKPHNHSLVTIFYVSASTSSAGRTQYRLPLHYQRTALEGTT